MNSFERVEIAYSITDLHNTLYSTNKYVGSYVWIGRYAFLNDKDTLKNTKMKFPECTYNIISV